MSESEVLLSLGQDSNRQKEPQAHVKVGKAAELECSGCLTAEHPFFIYLL